MENTAPKPFVFVLMPFNEDFDDIYRLGIRPACEAAGAYCERVDEQIFEGSITQRIYNQISKADIIVADMTGKNPNVFYETGYAHALNKRVILLTQHGEDIPFDLKDYPHIIYGGRITRLKDELEKRVAWWIAHTQEELARVDYNLDVYVQEVALHDNPQIPMLYFRMGTTKQGDELIEHFGIKGLRIRIENPSQKSRDEFDLALVLPVGDLYYLDEELAQEIDGDRVCYFIARVPKMFPKSWTDWDVSISNDGERPEATIQAAIRIFTDLGTQDFPFVLRPTQVFNEDRV